MLFVVPLSTYPVSAIPPYVPPPEPDIELYKGQADVDLVHLVIVVPFIPPGNS